jgi:benzoate transport
MSSELRESIGRGPMSGFQVSAIAICVGLTMLDGFDVLVVAFTAASISAEWSLSGKQMGLLLSSGLLGMSVGSLFLAPWGDRFGRRALILLCLSLMTAGMLLSAAARDIHELAVLRVLTGIGIGGLLAASNVITAEYSSDRWRSTAISAQATGYPIGATIGGLIAAALIGEFGWRSVFLFGALVSSAMIPVVLRGLPESLDFLIAKRPPHALRKLNVLLRRMQRGEVDALPAPPAEESRHEGRTALRRLLSGAHAASTVRSWSAFFLVMMPFYFVLSWTPKLLVTAGMSTQQGITGGVLLNLGGIAGGSAFGYLSSRFPLRQLTIACLVLTAGCLALFGALYAQLGAALPLALAIGAGIFGCMIGLYALAPELYPAATRSTGMGWAIGMGRLGAVVAPTAAGALIDAGWRSADLYHLFALPLLLAAFAVRSLRTS